MTRKRARQFTAFVLNLLLMQFIAVGSGSACTVHASQSTQTSAVADTPHETTHPASGAPHQVPSQAPADDSSAPGHCDVTCPPATCFSVLTCGATAAAPAAGTVRPLPFTSVAAIAPAVLAPRSLTTAPEPPPPRA